MALSKNTNNAPAATFEKGDDESFGTDEQALKQAAQPSAAERAKQQADEHKAAQEKAAVAAEKPSEQRAVAASTGNKVAIPMAKANPFPAFENAFEVEFNTFPQVKASQGQFKLTDGEKKMGEVIGGELVSFQYQWMLSPGDIDNVESKEFLRYSKDGKTAENGDNMHEILQAAKEAGFKKANIQKRMLLVACLTHDGKLEGTMVGKIIQIDLSKSSVQNFLRHQANVAFQVQKGTLPADFNPALLTLTATARSENKLDWTEVVFDVQQ